MSDEGYKSKVREHRYTAAALITVAGPALALALEQGGVSNWVAVVIAVGSVLTGAAGLGTAAVKTREQRNNGTFDPPPPPPAPVSPVDQVLGGLAEVTGRAVEAGRDLDKVTQAASSALGLGVNMADAVVDAIKAAKN